MTWPDLPPLNALVPFEATVRLGSLTKAAAELHVTHGAISRQLHALERSIGVTLFHRDGRALVPTAEAVEFHRQVGDSLGMLAAAVRRARPVTERQPLVLSCEPTLMMRWLLPRMPALSSEQNIELFLSAGGGPIDLQREGVDVALRRSDFSPDYGLVARPLFTEWIGLVCSPATAAALLGPSEVLHITRLTAATRPTAWATWARLQQVTLPEAPAQTFEHFYVSLEAASASLGVAVGPYPLVANDLESGRLVAPLGFVEDVTEYVLLHHQGNRDPRIGRLHNWLCAQSSTTVPPTSLRSSKYDPTKPLTSD